MTELAPFPLSNETSSSTARTPLYPTRDPITHLPIVILYPHSRCNCRCVMCDIWKSKAKDEISADEVAKWVAEWRTLGVERVVLSGGEPLMHSDLWELVGPLREAGMGVTILSTGILLERYADQIARYCDDVVISLDGPREVHNIIRNLPRAYEKLSAGAAALRAAKPDIHMSGRCTVQRQNFRSMRSTVAAAHALGLDRISFLAADVSSEAFNRPGGWDAQRSDGIALDASELRELDAELTALEREFRADFDDGFIAESPDKLRKRLCQYFKALRGECDFAPVACNAPWVSTVIESDGTVRPCYFQPALGNIRSADSLTSILNSTEAVAWRRGLDTRRDDICRKCVCSLALREPERTGRDAHD